MNYEFDYKKEDRIRGINSQKFLKEYLKDNAANLTKYQWLLVAKNKNFNLNIVDESYYDMLDWEYISMNIPLTMKEIENCSGYVNWYCISAFQKLTIPFIKKYKDYLSLNILIKNDSLDKETLNFALKVYSENNDMKHYEIWRDNLVASKAFRPVIKFREPTISECNIPKTEEIFKLQKNELKAYLDKYGIKYLYKNTLDELRQKLNQKYLECLNNINKEKSNENAKYKEALLQRIIRENQPILPKKEETPKPKKEKVKIDKNKQLEYDKMSKDELKKILDSRKVRYLYKDTLAILRQKCRESEVK